MEKVPERNHVWESGYKSMFIDYFGYQCLNTEYMQEFSAHVFLRCFWQKSGWPYKDGILILEALCSYDAFGISTLDYILCTDFLQSLWI